MTTRGDNLYLRAYRSRDMSELKAAALHMSELVFDSVHIVYYHIIQIWLEYRS